MAKGVLCPHCDVTIDTDLNECLICGWVPEATASPSAAEADTDEESFFEDLAELEALLDEEDVEDEVVEDVTADDLLQIALETDTKTRTEKKAAVKRKRKARVKRRPDGLTDPGTARARRAPAKPAAPRAAAKRPPARAPPKDEAMAALEEMESLIEDLVEVDVVKTRPRPKARAPSKRAARPTGIPSKRAARPARARGRTKAKTPGARLGFVLGIIVLVIGIAGYSSYFVAEGTLGIIAMYVAAFIIVIGLNIVWNEMDRKRSASRT